MDKEQLNKLLAQVHSELRNAESMDEDQRKALQKTADEIQHTLDKGDGTRLSHLAARLRSEIRQLEAKHPGLTLSIGELADTLSKIGV